MRLSVGIDRCVSLLFLMLITLIHADFYLRIVSTYVVGASQLAMVTVARRKG
jgi:hypothetical protein